MLVGLLAVSGCSQGALHEVTGTVTWEEPGKGETPVASGYITFVPDNKALGADGADIKDGKYVVKAKPGPCHVKIVARRDVPGEKGPMGEQKTEEYIPRKFNEQTELTADVGKGKDPIDFHLKP
jgi:hypothetical protein